VRVVSWNVQRARGARRAALVPALCAHEPDVAVLVDVPADEAGLLGDFRKAGFRWFTVATALNRRSRVMITSRVAITSSPPAVADTEFSDRWAEVVVPGYDVRIAGVYVPVTGNRPALKREMWRAIRAAAAVRFHERYMIVGDWNTGDHPLDKSHPGRPFRFTSEHRALADSGFVDAWRYTHPTAREYSWYRSDSRGFRIDHAFISPALRSQLKDCRYSHQERDARISDHSILIVDLE
jgi:exodeoxyribonuclease III